MSFQAPITVSDVISRIRSHRLLLPAIQREFVWSSEKVEWLFELTTPGISNWKLPFLGSARLKRKVRVSLL